MAIGSFILRWIIQPFCTLVIGRAFLGAAHWFGWYPDKQLTGLIVAAPTAFENELVLWVFVAFLGCVIWAIADYFLYRRKSQKTQKSETDETNAVADIWVLDAIHYLGTGDWERKIVGDDASTLLRVVGLAAKFIRQEAYDGRLTIWGRKSKLGVLWEIPKKYWEWYGLDVASLLADSGKHVRTELKEQARPTVGVCTFLKTNKKQIEALAGKFTITDEPESPQIEFIENKQCRREIIDGTQFLTELYVAVRNNNGKTINHLEVRLLDIDDGNQVTVYSKRLQSDDGEETQVILHPGTTVYFRAIEVSQRCNDRSHLSHVLAGPFSKKIRNLIERGPYRIKFRINGENIPTKHQFYKFEVSQHGTITFERASPFSDRKDRI